MYSLCDRKISPRYRRKSTQGLHSLSDDPNSSAFEWKISTTSSCTSQMSRWHLLHCTQSLSEHGLSFSSAQSGLTNIMRGSPFRAAAYFSGTRTPRKLSYCGPGFLLAVVGSLSPVRAGDWSRKTRRFVSCRTACLSGTGAAVPLLLQWRPIQVEKWLDRDTR